MVVALSNPTVSPFSFSCKFLTIELTLSHYISDESKGPQGLDSQMKISTLVLTLLTEMHREKVLKKMSSRTWTGGAIMISVEMHRHPSC